MRSFPRHHEIVLAILFASTAIAAGGDLSANAADQAGGINLSISIGGSKSQSNTVQTADNAAGSTVAAGGDISIRASGAGQNSDLTVQGSSIQTGNNVTLQADDQINLLAAQSTADQHSTNKSISGSIGTGGMGITVSASGARGAMTQEAAQEAAALAQAEKAVAQAKIEAKTTTQAPEADFAGQIPVRPRDGAVPPGTAAVDTPLGQHLIEAQIVGSGKNAAVSGGHNMNNFDAALQQAGGVIIGKAEIGVDSGIYQIQYQLPGGKVQPKTVYDPAKYSDVQMVSMASEAAGKAIVQWGINQQSIQFVEVNGVTFRVPISNRGGQPHIPTVFPTDPKQAQP